MGIKKIMCCCGSGLGSSLMIRLNVEKALKKLGISGVEVMHSSLSDASANAADLFVVGDDLENFTHSFPKVVLLTKHSKIKVILDLTPFFWMLSQGF